MVRSNLLVHNNLYMPNMFYSIYCPTHSAKTEPKLLKEMADEMAEEPLKVETNMLLIQLLTPRLLR